MQFIVGLGLGLIFGFIGGALVWRKNGARVESAAKAVETDVKNA